MSCTPQAIWETNCYAPKTTSGDVLPQYCTIQSCTIQLVEESRLSSTNFNREASSNHYSSVNQTTELRDVIVEYQSQIARSSGDRTCAVL